MPQSHLQTPDDAGTLPSAMESLFHIGDVVRKLRDRRKWNQTMLGEKSGGLDKGTISRVEEGANVKRETIEAVARGLGLTMAQLYALLPPPVVEEETPRAPDATAGDGFRSTGTEGTTGAGRRPK